MRRLRAGWTSFRRIHLAALIADWRRTLLSVIGVALGVTVVLGVLVLKSELSRPFDSFGPSLTHAADIGVVEVTPNVSGRLPIETVDRLQTDVAGAQAVIPIVAALTPVDVARRTVTGSFCSAGRARSSFWSARSTANSAPATSSPQTVPACHSRCPRPSPSDMAYSSATNCGSPACHRVRRTWVGRSPSSTASRGSTTATCCWPRRRTSPRRMLSTPGYVTAAFVLPRQGADVTADADRVIAGIATAGPPRPHLPAVFANSTQGLNLTALAGIIVGILIAVNTVLLAVEDRRAVMGTIGAIGAKPVGLFGGMLGEGAVVGLLGGLLGVPSGFLLGEYLVDRFGRSMLAGSGGSIAAHFTPNLIVIGAAAGIVCGVLAMFGPAARLVRDGPLASMASIGGVQRARTIPMWPLIVGAGLLAAAVVLLKIFERGSLPLSMGINGLTVGLCGVVLVTAWIAPRAAGLSSGLLTKVRPAVGRLLGADIRRYTLLFALSAALLAESTSLAIGSNSMQLLGTEQIAAQKADRLPAALLISAQSVLDQRDGRLSDSTFELVDRRRRRAERVVALAVDDLVGDVVATGRRRHAGRLVQPSSV